MGFNISSDDGQLSQLWRMCRGCPVYHNGFCCFVIESSLTIEFRLFFVTQYGGNSHLYSLVLLFLFLNYYESSPYMYFLPLEYVLIYNICRYFYCEFYHIVLPNFRRKMTNSSIGNRIKSRQSMYYYHT